LASAGLPELLERFLAALGDHSVREATEHNDPAYSFADGLAETIKPIVKEAVREAMNQNTAGAARAVVRTVFVPVR
jgi:hypothetical protein